MGVGTGGLGGRCTGHAQSGEWWPEIPPGQRRTKAAHPHRGAHAAAGPGPLFTHILEGAVQGGAHSLRLVGKCDSCKASRPAANKALAGGGIRAAHCGARAAFWGTGTAPWGPGPASADTQYLLSQASSGLPPP